MSNKKITKRDRYTEMVAIFEGMGREDLVKFAQHEMELLEKKNAGKSKVTKAEQEKRDALADAVLTILRSEVEPIQNKDICKAMPDKFGVVTTQRLTHILSNLVEKGEITALKEKGRTVYVLA